MFFLQRLSCYFHDIFNIFNLCIFLGRFIYIFFEIWTKQEDCSFGVLFLVYSSRNQQQTNIIGLYSVNLYLNKLLSILNTERFQIVSPAPSAQVPVKPANTA